MIAPLTEEFERCQRRFPTVQLPMAAFQSRVEEIRAPGKNRPGKEPAIYYEDLFLATACARDDRVAWEYFADDYLPILKKCAVQACGNAVEGEDLAQEITARLLKEKDRLARYDGRGSLAAWLRVTVAHAAIDRFRRASRLTSLDNMEENEAATLLQKTANRDDGESLDSKWGPVVSRIAGERLRALPVKDRLLLNLYYLHGLSLKDIGRQLGIHEATASRWLDRTRHGIRKEIERELRKRHGLRASEVHSLWKWISPQTVSESIPDIPLSNGDLTCEEGPHPRKKSAIEEKSGVINKEEVR